MNGIRSVEPADIGREVGLRPRPPSEPHHSVARKARLRELGFATYGKYLESPEWKERRRAFLIPYGGCEVCPRMSVQLHHKTYERLGHERHEDLVWLCQECHDGVHLLVDEAGASLATAVEDYERLMQVFVSARVASSGATTPSWSGSVAWDAFRAFDVRVLLGTARRRLSASGVETAAALISATGTPTASGSQSRAAPGPLSTPDELAPRP